MPQLVGNSWAWFRAFLSKDGPKDRETRLTLVGHLRFMQGNGRGCWAGARTIGVTTWQNKATVLKHRAKAIQEGWLVPAPAGKCRRHGELWASVPDGVTINPKYLAIPVLPDRTGCPTVSDRSPDNSLTPEELPEDEKAMRFARSREALLRAWLAASPLAKTYWGDIDTMGRLAPAWVRFKDYHIVIQAVVEEARKGGTDDGK